jgi:long-subunit acyl-CoA synthetase (AMP-forming)
MEARFVDEDGNDVPHGQDGELWMKGPNVFKGYLNNDAATKNSFTDDGWFKTGDVGHVTDEGYIYYARHSLTIRMFYITDRVKELIKFKGSNNFQLASHKQDSKYPPPPSKGFSHRIRKSRTLQSSGSILNPSRRKFREHTLYR